jgi:HK97 family phage portal protein
MNFIDTFKTSAFVMATKVAKWASGGSFSGWFDGSESYPGSPANISYGFENLIKKGFRRNAWVYACMTIIADAVAFLPVCIGEPNETGKLEPLNDPSDELTILMDRPNSQYSWEAFMKLFTLILIGSGESYILGRNSGLEEGSNKPEALFALPTHLVTPKQSEIWGMISHFEYNPPSGSMTTYTTDEMLQVRLNTDPLEGIRGISPLEAAFGSASVNVKSNIWLNSLLDNGTRPGTYFSFKSGVTPSDAVIKDAEAFVDKLYAGGHNANKSFFSSNLEPHILSYPPMDMGIVDLKKDSRLDICSAFRVPPPLVGDLSKANYNNIKQVSKNFFLNNIIPLTDLIVKELNVWLASRYDRGQFYIDYDQIDEIKDDQNERIDRLVKRTASGQISPNDAARITGVEEDKLGPEGEKRYIPSSWVELGSFTQDFILPRNNQPKDD